jgi:exodeoxyribonuclease V beta subunit
MSALAPLPLLDWRTMPLGGRVLIEASAGTGKTWNIGLIFLRLILEQELPVERIIVVTFTEAAAQELRERLRARLAEAERCLQGACDGASELARWLAQKYTDTDARHALRRIQLARVDIDRAPIATIHAVCRRILRDFPLEAGSGFGTDKLLDETELLRECIEDFWRRRYLVGKSDPTEDDVLAKGPDDLLFDLRDLLTRDARVLPLDTAAPARARVVLAAYEYCRAEIPYRARSRDGQTYSMLIGGVYERVVASRMFADRLYQEFPAALIDEFQDTDRRQFAIFDRIYRDAAGVPRGLLAMIGDPKQAIYAFRGGDIAAYLHAREQATARYALATNQRSSSALIAACNELYAHTDGGFEDTRVSYQKVTPAGRADEKPYASDGKVLDQPFVIHAFRNDASIEGVGKLDELALNDCAARIVELLNDPARTIGGKRVTPGDVAVLLPQNRQVADLRQRLMALNVPCVGSGRGSVFDTDVARELELVMYAVLHAGDERAVRGALATRLLGKTYAEILAWQSDSGAFEKELDRFATWRAAAQSRGFMAVLRDLLAERGAELLALPDGERLLTDLRHLGEAIADEETVSGLDGAYAWFAAVRREGDDVEVDAADARQLRIESDAQRVQLMTMHAAKGLEFSVVFLPLAWRIAARDGAHSPKVLRFHGASGDACVDLNSSSASSSASHFREDLQERMRLLYVGLTRAIHAVHVYWVDREKARTRPEHWQKPAIDRLIRPALQKLGLNEGDGSLVALAQRLTCIGVEPAYTGLKVRYSGVAQADQARRAREPLPDLRAFAWLHSFSSLTRRAVADHVEAAATDEGEAVEAPDEAPSDARTDVDTRLLDLDIWRGRHFGDAVHKLLQNAPAGPIWPTQRAWLVTRLGLQGVRPNAESAGDAFEAVARMLDRTRCTDLGDGLYLDALPSHSRVAEFEFQLPVAVALRRLRVIGIEHGCADVISEHLSTTVLNGMLTGFADLIFEYRGRYHVLDYKTNRLGLRLSDYSSAALDAAMREHQYPLQALLYTVALHRYLRERLRAYDPEQHLGDSWYLFTRAIGLGEGTGVWRRSWPIGLIEALDEAFASEALA